MGAPHNPPAFPQPYSDDGMSLLDYFAGKALTGLASATDGSGLWTSDPNSTAEKAYQFADAMLAARDARAQIEAPAPEFTEFAEVFNEDLDAAPRDGTYLMGKLADDTEKVMVWWLNWPGWREVGEMEVMGEPVAPVAWRRLTSAEACEIEIPF